MLKWLLRIPLLAASFLLASHALTAQDVVHALTGTVNIINPAAKTVVVTTDDGAVSVFDQMTGNHKSAGLEKLLRNGAVAADAFNQKGAQVIVFYTGWGEPRMAIAFQPLGPGPFTTTSGTVEKFDKGNHLLSIKEPSGVIDSIKVATETVAETGTGAVDGSRFDPARGQRVRVTSTQINGTEKALFIYAAFAN